MTFVDLTRDPPVARVTLNRPERLNALGDDVRRQLHAVLRSLEDDDTVRVVVLGGAGRVFSAGADLKDGTAMPDAQYARHIAAGRWQRLLDDLEALPQVTVARLHGAVVGGAALLAVACDLRVAADDLAFSIPEVALGIPLTWAGLPRLAREIGLPRTREVVMTGRVVRGDEALQWGLVHRVVGGAELDQAVDHLVEQLVGMPAGPLVMTKAALAALGRDTGSFAAAWADPELLAFTLRDPETLEAFRAYRQRSLGTRSGD